MRVRRAALRLAAAAVLAILLSFVLALARHDVSLGTDWRTADRTSRGIAPAPETTPEAVVQVYAARAVRWRGLFAVHTWLAVKPENAEAYTVHHVVGWNVRRGRPVVVSLSDVPDRSWYGNAPELLNDLRGPEAEGLIPRIQRAVKSYPYPHTYRAWPGPNSNTFVAWVGREVPELRLNLPPTAIGKDYLPRAWVHRAPSGRGVQVSLFGLLGATVAPVEGLELNLLGLNLGIDALVPALKLPAVGRLGFSRSPAGPGGG
ncbi:MAG: DUF3750 domain-containing protein [Deferrisomatales bacterium]